MIMANQGTRVRIAVVRDGRRTTGGDNSDIKVYQAFAGDSPRLGAHSVGSVAYRAREAILFYVAGVLAEAGVIQDLIKVVAFGAKSIRTAAGATLCARVWVREQVGNKVAREWRLAELIPAFEDVRKDGPVRAAWSRPAKFAIVVAVVAVRAKNASGHDATRCLTVKIDQIRAQAGLWQHAAAILEHRMGGRGKRAEFRNDIHRIAGHHRPGGRIAEVDAGSFTGTGAVAAQTILVLIHGHAEHRLSIRGANALHHALRRANPRGGGKSCHSVRRMRIMAICASDVQVLIQQNRFVREVRCVTHGKCVPKFGRDHFGQNIGRGRGDIRTPIMAIEAGKVVHRSQQRSRVLGIVLSVA